MSLIAELYTDGSCHPQYGVGAWVAIIFTDNNKKVLSGTGTDTNHNRMELTAVIMGIEYLKKENSKINSIKIFTDSQYVRGLPLRKEKLISLDFTTNAGKKIQNADLVISLFKILDTFNVEWVKIKAHQKKKVEKNFNIDADKICRKIMRDLVKKSSNKKLLIHESHDNPRYRDI